MPAKKKSDRRPSLSLKPQTLTMAIQGVDFEITNLNKQLKKTSAKNKMAADLQELLLAYDLAALDLKNAYIRASKFYSNMTPYSDLVDNDNWSN